MSENNIEQLIRLIAKLPGIGNRSARRIALHLIKHRETLMRPLSSTLATTADAIKTCSGCGNLDSSDPCNICNDNRRQSNIICVVEEVADLWAMERSNVFRGRYHVLGGTLSALDGRGPDQLNIASLIARASAPEVEEVILANNATVEGQTTAHYITESLKNASVSITRLAHGIPIGGELDYLDDGTLHAALKARQTV
jgi:recombination protein RecR